MKAKLLALGTALGASVVALPVAAEDWTSVTGAIDFSGEIAGVVAVVGVLAGFYVVRKGARLLLSMLK